MRLVIPCYNEERRLRAELVAELLEDPRIRILFVDDGSEDGTAALLDRLIASSPSGRAARLSLGENRGKAEAVRAGLRCALDEGEELLGYCDADFATPPSELRRLLDHLESSGREVVLGCRVARLGADIDRRMTRHYLGRVFATVASVVLRLRVYDTQCGAKLFRASPALRRALAVPFRSRWAFDVELLGRLTFGDDDSPGLGAENMLEVPLDEWQDVGGSKLGSRAMLRAGFDLLSLAAKVGRRGRSAFF
ncbi:MAG: glycosyltransferase [Sandaracinaceae bacterium]